MNSKNYTRTFLDSGYEKGMIISLEKKYFHHEINVLRKKNGDKFILFDGKGNSSLCKVIEINRKHFSLEIIKLFEPSLREGIEIELGQSLIKNDPFNFSIQKATELGVKKFSPIISERVVIKGKRSDSTSREEKWRQIAQGACEQCGENWIPEISSPLDIKEWSETVSSKTKIVLFPNAEARLSDIEIKDSVSIAIGPEGDFTEKEISYLKESGFLPVTIGKRILRAETAAISVISSLRYGAKEF
jgi:16S rRNA (uracil1498-N3)-methyltransferase